MEKLSLIGMQQEKDSIISQLMELGVVEVTDLIRSKADKHSDTEEEPVFDAELEKQEEFFRTLKSDGDEEQINKLDTEINKTAIALEAIEKYGVDKEPLFPSKIIVTETDIKRYIDGNKEVRDDIRHVLWLNDKLHKNRDKINKLTTDLASIIPWMKYDLPLNLTDTEKTSIELGVVPSTVDLENLKKKLSENHPLVDMREVTRDREFIYIFVLAIKDKLEDYLDELKKYGFSPLPFKGFEGTATVNKERIERQIDKHKNEIRAIEKNIKDMLGKLDQIKIYYDCLVMRRDKELLKRKIKKTDKTFAIKGWVPSKLKPKVDKLLESFICIHNYEEPNENDTVPVLVDNSSLVAPFEVITEMYSLPDYKGIDPTRFFAFLYAMFFGIMLSDAGYGLVITIACLVIKLRFELEGMMKKVIGTFFYCGISTVFWGAMFGGWFGDFFQVAAKVLLNKEITIKPIWFNPIEDPTKLLIWSLGFGVVHLFLGLALRAYMLIKRGQVWDAICDVVSWYLVIGGAILYGAGGNISPLLVKPGMYMAIAGVIILLLTGGRQKKGFGKVIGGLGQVYNVTSYVADILSYARLLALGLATGVIATVVNTMGSMAGNGIISFIVLILVGIIGHTFNIAINLLGAFVHSSRLQYIEFFGKFYEDGGEAFEPFRQNTKYIKIKKRN